MNQITKIRTALTTIALTTAVIGAVGLTAPRDAHANLFDQVVKNITAGPQINILGNNNQTSN
jgi:hypothetical protein